MLKRLLLRGFRNLEDAELEFGPHGLALVGPNAQGKSNFLEAIYYLEVLRSARGTRDTRLIRFGADHFRIVGHLDRGADPDRDPGAGPVASSLPSTVAAAVQRSGSGHRKKVTLDGEEPERLGDAVGHLGAVLFTPEDVRLVSAGPAERRRFLDILLSVNHPGYLEALQRYRQVLGHRNAALREGGSPAAIGAWDGLLARASGTVAAARAGWVQAGEAAFERLYGDVSGGEEATMDYRSGTTGVDAMDPTDMDDPGAWEACHLEALRDGLDSDRDRGVTRSGPHRDDLRFQVAGKGTDSGLRDLREYGSAGQQRTAALALRLLEADTRRERLGRAPLLLLDDVFAELDEARSRRILELLHEAAAGQVFLTAPSAADVRLRSDELPRWSIDAGRIETGGAP